MAGKSDIVAERGRGRRGRLRFANDMGWNDRAEDGFSATGRGRGRGGGRRRVMDNGQLRLILLHLLSDNPSHGYELIRAIEERTGGSYMPSPGIIYPTLTLLAETDLVAEQATEGARKLYGITEEGAAFLAAHQKELDLILAKLGAMGDTQDGGGITPARRAVHNLRLVLQNKVAAGIEEDRLYEAVELIDEVARKIERL